MSTTVTDDTKDTGPTTFVYRLEVALFWPGIGTPETRGVQWEKPFESAQAAWGAALDDRKWFQARGREVEMWLYQGDYLVGHAARR